MAEKFKRTPSSDAEDDVAKRTFDMAGGTIKVRMPCIAFALPAHECVSASLSA